MEKHPISTSFPVHPLFPNLLFLSSQASYDLDPSSLRFLLVPFKIRLLLKRPDGSFPFLDRIDPFSAVLHGSDDPGGRGPLDLLLQEDPREPRRRPVVLDHERIHHGSPLLQTLQRATQQAAHSRDAYDRRLSADCRGLQKCADEQSREGGLSDCIGFG